MPQLLVEDLQCAVLRNETVSWPGNATKTFINDFITSSAYHGVQALLYHQLKSTPSWKTWPTVLQDTLSRAAREQTALEMIREPALAKLIDTLTENRIFPILMKGGALAYTHYPSPNLRPRCDTDLFIPKGDLGKLSRVLQALGYTTYPIRGELTTYQAQFSKPEIAGISNDLDVHWRINNRQCFAATLDYAGAQEMSVPIPQLHPQARSLAPPHALLLACLHRAANLQGQQSVDGNTSRDRLIWLYDIHLLLKAMTLKELDVFVELCQTFQVRTVCLDALKCTQTSLHTVLPHSVVNALADIEKSEISAGYLTSSRLTTLYLDFRFLPRWRDRIKLLMEYSFPDSQYMMDRYAVSQRIWLPFAYSLYLLQGTRKLLRAIRQRRNNFH